MKISTGRIPTAVAALLAANLLSTSGQVFTPSAALEPPVIEPIGPVTLIPVVQPFHGVFPNMPDPFHPKFVYFEGHGVSLIPGQLATVSVSFDWHLDPTDPPGDPGQTTTPVDFIIPDTGGPIYLEFLIPICPPWVSIHFETDFDVQIQGVFVHQCIPEPAEYGLLAGLGAVLFGLARRRMAT